MEASSASALSWAKSYIYAGKQIAFNNHKVGDTSEVTGYNHPDRLGTIVDATIIQSSQPTNEQEKAKEAGRRFRSEQA